MSFSLDSKGTAARDKQEIRLGLTTLVRTACWRFKTVSHFFVTGRTWTRRCACRSDQLTFFRRRWRGRNNSRCLVHVWIKTQLNRTVRKMPPGFFTFLLSSKRDLGCHDSLSLGDEITVRTSAVPPFAESLVAFENRNNTVVSAAGAFRRSLRYRTHWRHWSGLELRWRGLKQN